MRYFLTLAFYALSFSLFSQKQLEAISIDEEITIDGKLNEATWDKTETGQKWTQIKPSPGDASHVSTSVQMRYDKHAIYFAFHCYDDPTQMSKVLSLRDDYSPNCDLIGIFLDTYNDNQNGFFFGVTSRGVQLDAKIAANDYNDKLNLVWYSAVKIVDDGWIVELKIPYSAFRFPKKEVQSWGINFSRQVSRLREESSWEKVNPDLENMLLESGDVTGVSHIEPPLRLAFMPYISSYFNKNPGSNAQPALSGGLDIKYGVNEAFTLDMTLVPDFRQVVFDQQVLNLTPFEVQFNENRQFFTEGMELFNKAGLFYSRRIGIQAPQRVTQTLLKPGEYLENVPQSSKLYNASKYSGRMKNGLGLGVFNAVNAEQFSTAISTIDGTKREVMISPLTNYNVLVLDQNLKNNSSVTFTNTNVWRAGSFYDANVSGLNFNINTNNNEFNFNGKGAFSAQFDTQNKTGYSYNLNAQKQRGALVGGVGYLEESDTYDPNDLGFNYNNNRRIIEVSAAYRNFKPENPKIMKWIIRSSVSRAYLYNPSHYVGTYSNTSAFLLSKHFDAFGISNDNSIGESYDFFEPRVWGRSFIRPAAYAINPWVSTNYQKRLALDAGFSINFVQRENWREYNFNFSPRFRLSNGIFLIYSFEKELLLNAQGFAVPFGSPSNVPDGIIFGSRDRNTLTQSVALDCIMTKRMGFSFRLRHYRSAISYTSFYTLAEDGRLQALPTFTGLDIYGNSAYNLNYNAFTIDFTYRWVFKPGSEINLVWKNSVFSADQAVQAGYWQNLNTILQQGPTNSLSFKFIYWLDAQQLKGH
ncbi:MAG: hypothetical protein RLZZ301_1270 [Bacteroidota bacterium]|jgi:hypothetical protein